MTRPAPQDPRAIEELLRFDGPINHSTFRYSVEPVHIGGTEIPAGEMVFVALPAANRDPARFAAADRLDLTRDCGGHLAFGHGVHYCVGAPLARMEAAIALARLAFAAWSGCPSSCAISTLPRQVPVDRPLPR